VRRERRRWGWRALALAAALAPAAGASAETITLSWRYPEAERVAGFRVHLGPAPGQYTRSVDVGRPSADAAGVFRARLEVPDGETTHLAISAYDARGAESPRSQDQARASSTAAPGRPGRPELVAP